MRFAGFVLGLLSATILQTLGTRLWAPFPAYVDLFLVLAVYNSLENSVAWSTLGGSAAGLGRDALSGGPFGLHGFAATLVVHLAARLQQRLVIQQPLQVGALLALAAALQLATLATLQFLLVAGSELPSLTAMGVRMASSGAAGAVLYMLANRTRAAGEQWREKRRRRLRISSG